IHSGGVLQNDRSFLFVARKLQLADVQSFHLDQLLTIFVEREIQLTRDLLPFRRASEALFRARDGGFNLARLPAFEARRPVRLAQAVEYRPSDSELGIRL